MYNQQNNPYMQGYPPQNNMQMPMQPQNNYAMGIQQQNMQNALRSSVQTIPQPQYYSQQMLRQSQPIGYPANQYYGMNAQNPAMPQMPNSQYPPGNYGYPSQIPQNQIPQNQMPQNQMMQNPLSTGAIPQTFLPPLQVPPSMPYIPPPSNIIIGIPIDRTKQNVFTNLYSSLAVLNVIYDLYANNVIDEKAKNQIFETQMNVFNINKRILGIQTLDQLKQFAQTANLDISYVEKNLAATFTKTTNVPTRESMQFYLDLGSKLTEFDNVILLIEGPSDYNTYRYEIQSRLSMLIRDVKKVDVGHQKESQINILEYYFTFTSNNSKMEQGEIDKMKNLLNEAINDIRVYLMNQ